MRIDDFPHWGVSPVETTKPTEVEWCGISIAPGSDEGLILVDDVPLAAGRILPIRSKKYAIKHVRPVYKSPDLELGLVPIRTLSVCLFEDPAEFGCGIERRPTQNYNAASKAAGFAGSRALFAPFVGRRQALYTLESPDLVGAFHYTVKGARWSYSAGKVIRYTLHDDAAANLGTDGTLAFYVGGDDNAECWDALELYIFTAATWHVDVDTIGEIGAP